MFTMHIEKEIVQVLSYNEFVVVPKRIGIISIGIDDREALHIAKKYNLSLLTHTAVIIVNQLDVNNRSNVMFEVFEFIKRKGTVLLPTKEIPKDRIIRID